MYDVKQNEDTERIYLMGTIDHFPIIKIEITKNKDSNPKVALSSVLPVDFEKARQYMNCMNEAFKQAEKILFPS